MSLRCYCLLMEKRSDNDPNSQDSSSIGRTIIGGLCGLAGGIIGHIVSEPVFDTEPWPGTVLIATLGGVVLGRKFF